MPSMSCLRLLVQLMRLAASRTFCTAGRSRPIRMAMMAMTTSSSMSVKAARDRTNRIMSAPGVKVLAAPCTRLAASIAAQLQPHRGELFADLVEARHAEVLGFHELVGRARDQFGERRDAQPVHALAGADGEVQVADRLAEHGLLFGREVRLRPVAHFVGLAL